MIAVLIQPGLLELVGVSYLAAGGVVAAKLGDRLGWAGRIGALAAWPVFLPLLSGPTGRPGPHGPRIIEVFSALERTLADPAADGVPWTADLSGLRQALTRSDERIALVDRLICDAGSAPTGPLKSAREQAATELQAVLDEVVQLRMQIGLAALHGNAESVKQRLSELLDRARAIDEVTGLHG